jgi:hypothetical protein
MKIVTELNGSSANYWVLDLKSDYKLSLPRSRNAICYQERDSSPKLEDMNFY